MILKLQDNEEESWIYYECDKIHTRYDLLKNINIFHDTKILFEMEPIKGNDSKNVKIINLHLRKTHIERIVTDRVCYILNNEGKTIDKV